MHNSDNLATLIRVAMIARGRAEYLLGQWSTGQGTEDDLGKRLRDAQLLEMDATRAMWNAFYDSASHGTV